MIPQKFARAAFDDFLDDAELPDELLPSERFTLPTPRGNAAVRGPRSYKPLLPTTLLEAANITSRTRQSAPAAPASVSTPQSAQAASARVSASQPALAASARLSALTAAAPPRVSALKPALAGMDLDQAVKTSTRLAQYRKIAQASGPADDGLAAALGSTAAPVLSRQVAKQEASVAGAASMATPPRPLGRIRRSCEGLGLTPPALEQKRDAHSPSFSTSHLESPGVKRPKHAAVDQKSMGSVPEQGIAAVFLDTSTSEATLDFVATGRQSTSCLEVVPYVDPGALFGSRNSCPSGGEVVLYEDAAQPIVSSLASGVSVKPGKKRERKNKYFEEVRGSDLVEISADDFDLSWADRPKRRRIPTLEFWRGERVIYEKLPGSAGLTATAVVFNKAGDRERSLAIEDREARLAIQDKRRLPALKDKARQPAIKDKPRQSALKDKPKQPALKHKPRQASKEKPKLRRKKRLIEDDDS